MIVSEIVTSYTSTLYSNEITAFVCILSTSLNALRKKSQEDTSTIVTTQTLYKLCTGGACPIINNYPFDWLGNMYIIEMAPSCNLFSCRILIGKGSKNGIVTSRFLSTRRVGTFGPLPYHDTKSLKYVGFHVSRISKDHFQGCFIPYTTSELNFTT